MKNGSLLLFSLLFCLFMTNCGDDGDESDCAPADWVGTFEISSDAECDLDPMSTIVFNDEIVLALGSSDDFIDWDGGDEQLTGCTAFDGINTITLSGNTITAQIGECTATYTRK